MRKEYDFSKSRPVPKGLRGRSAKPPFVGSSPTRAFKRPRIIGREIEDLRAKLGRRLGKAELERIFSLWWRYSAFTRLLMQECNHLKMESGIVIEMKDFKYVTVKTILWRLRKNHRIPATIQTYQGHGMKEFYILNTRKRRAGNRAFMRAPDKSIVTYGKIRNFRWLS